MSRLSFMHKFIFFVIVFFSISVNVLAFDFDRERQYAEVLQTMPIQGESVSLKADDIEFLGLYLETEAVQNKGTVIVLHDMGGHPDQKFIVHALRTSLPEHGWASLSLQMPILELGASTHDYLQLFPDAAKRIRASIEYLKTNGTKNITLAGYGLGALMAVYYQAENPITPVKAIAAISLPVPENDPGQIQSLSLLEKIRIPVLDIYADQDYAEVLRYAREKRIAANQNEHYRHVKIASADHSYLHNEDILVKRLYSWLAMVPEKQ